MLSAAAYMPLCPLLGFLILLAFGRRIGIKYSGIVATVAVAASFVLAAISWTGLLGISSSKREITQSLFTWLPVGSLQVKVAFLIDPLSITMCLFITFISTMIHLYSIGYMKGERDYVKFFIYLNLFVTAMLVLVMANNMVLTFVGWEGVGACSYWLVAFYFEKESAAVAGKKAFVYNRIGDVGLLLAMFIVFARVGSLDYTTIFAHLSAFSPLTATMLVLALLLAATGKSAQIPLFNWLPGSMEGPTPVSALIHAATMVTAGVYLLCRMSHVLELSAHASLVIAIIGALTAFVAATMASVQRDIKAVLAYSTISQLGYMILAVGAGAYVAAIFLMIAHAFYKALLFLSAGAVSHGLDGERDMGRMGALRKVMPWTTGVFIVGWLAIAGVPPLSAFWSKGDVLDAVFRHYPFLWALALFTAFLTAYYMTRMYTLTFTGEARYDKPGVDGAPALHAHEAPWVMRIPLLVLAVGAAGAGLLNLPWVHSYGLEEFLAPVFHGALYNPHEGTALLWLLAVVDSLIAVGGIAVAWMLWRGKVSAANLEPDFLTHDWYWDDLYDTVFGRPGTALALFSATTIDEKILDGAVNGVGGLAVQSAQRLRRIQTGQVRQYALLITGGMAALLVFILMRVF